jgi:hypothetical protein
MALSRNQTIGIVAASVLAAFVIGFLPMWTHARNLDDQLTEARYELQLARLQGRLGAALTEAMRSNYERGRQLMAGFFTELQAVDPALRSPEERQAAEQILQQRDEIITLLSRAEPESVQRLMLLYTRFAGVVDPALQPGGSGTTPDLR